MATRLIGTDSANPRLPTVVITATQGYTHADLAPGDVLADANAYTDAQIAGIIPGGIPFVNVVAYGAVGDGATDDTEAIQAALAAANTEIVVFPAGTYRISAPLTPLAGTTIVGSAGATISQATQFKPVFDLFNVGNVSVSGLALVNASGPPASMGSGSFRGDSEYAYSAGVWANTGHNTVADVTITNFAMGCYFNSSDGSTNIGDHVERVGNTVRNVEISGANHGILFLNQRGLIVDGVYSHDHVDSSAGTNPTHGVYGTGAAADTSTDIAVTNCVTATNPAGHAYQFKYVDGLILSNLHARACKGLFNGIDVSGVNGVNLSSVGDTADGASSWASFVIATGTVVSSRCNFANVTIQAAVEAIHSFIVTANDSMFSNFTFYVIKNGLNISAADFRIAGLRDTLRGWRATNTGSSTSRAFRIEGTAPGDITISAFELDNYRHICEVISTATGTNVISYDPAAQRRILFGAGLYINAVSGTPPFTVIRSPTTITYPVNSTGTKYPLAGLETVTRFNVVVASAFTVSFPQIGAVIGMFHEIAIVNATAAPLGAITWDAAYVFATAPTAPAAGATKHWRFMYDGTKWREAAHIPG